EQLKEMHLKNNTEIEKLKENDNEKSKRIQQLNVYKQIDNLQHESVKKDTQITELKNSIQQLERLVKSNNDEQCKQIEKINVKKKKKKKTFEIKHLKSEKELNEKNQNEEISKMDNNNLILKQQLDNLFIEIEQLKKEIKFKGNQAHEINNHNEDKKEHDSNYQILQSKSNLSYTFSFDLFRSSSKSLNTLTKHNSCIYNIDYSRFNGHQFICSGSNDKTVRVWDIDKNKQIRLFDGHLSEVYCVKFSPYHYQSHHYNVICSSSLDEDIRFWDFKNNQQLQLFRGHQYGVCGIEFSPFNGGRYLCSGSYDYTIRLWDVETSKALHIFKGHKRTVWCVDISPLQSNNKNDNNNNNNNNNNKMNNIGVIGGNGYTICSGSNDTTIRIWDIETAKQCIAFKGHKCHIKCVKYGSNELGINGGANTILSGSNDKSVRLWDIRSGQQIQVFNEHTDSVNCAEYSPFVVNNVEIGSNSNVICSGSDDNTIRFWDIRSNKNQLYVLNGNDEEHGGIKCLKFLSLKKKTKSNEQISNENCCVNLCYGSNIGLIHVWG
ncbi:WD-40 repeat protein, partial [Reticulomyxa filosa]